MHRASKGARAACALAVGRGLATTLVVLASAAGHARAQECAGEGECTFEKPNILIVMDYSSSMVGSSADPAYFPETQDVTTRWDAQLDAVRALVGNVDFTDNMHIALARFGHDPDPGAAGTTIGTDTSEPQITDGFALDVGFDDDSGAYLDCNADSLLAEIDSRALTPPPEIGGGVSDTMGTWTRGALASALALIEQTRANHPEDVNRTYEVVLMTDGDWNCPDSFTQGDCPDEDPAPQATTLLAGNVRVHVVGFADAAGIASLDAVASNGGTGAAIDASSPDELTAALDGVLQGVRDSVVVPECIGGLPRVMVIMDASSSMLVGGAPGESNWDKARYALAGNPAAPNAGDAGYVQPIFDRTVDLGSTTVTIEDVVHIGLIGFNTAADQELMLQYAPCARDNIAWAMDPSTSCVAPGCTDPYSGTPDWTFQNSDSDRVPPFVQTTMSFLPPCNDNGAERCLGTMFNTFTGEGVQFASDNVDAYKVDSGAFNQGDTTPFVNILITDGETSAGSTAVEPVLAAMEAAGIGTYVIGFGSPADLNEAQLDAYAAAGGTGSAITVNPDAGGSADALSQQIADIIGGVGLDPCCRLNDCSEQPEPALPFCGNGELDAGEVCDSGADNGIYGSDCNATCTVPSGGDCGDAIVNGDEVCDDGHNSGEHGGCATDCSAREPYCGDGEVNGTAACDDGNGVDGDGCSASCEDEAVEPQDAGVTDPPDAGAPDAGAPDAGAPDAGAPDGGAGSPDAGSTGAAGDGADPGAAGAPGAGEDPGAVGNQPMANTPQPGVGMDALGVTGLDDGGDDGGCGCRVPGEARSSQPLRALPLLALGLLLALRRWRR